MVELVCGRWILLTAVIPDDSWKRAIARGLVQVTGQCQIAAFEGDALFVPGWSGTWRRR
jgi:hypothetical protein